MFGRFKINPFFVAVFILIITKNSFAQDDEPLFRTININGGLLMNDSKGLINKFWKTNKGVFFISETQFYFGNLDLGFFYSRFTPTSNVPPYKNIFIFLGYGKELHLPWNLSISNGIRAGFNLMRFETDSISIYERNESELGVSIFSKLNIGLTRRINLNLTADLTHIFTKKRIRILTLSAGAGYAFTSPQWLREFLK